MKKQAGVAVALLLGLALVGCGAGAAVSAPKAAPPLVIVQAPNGTYTDNFNPFSPNALNGTLGPIYETLFYFNLEGTQVDPMLGKSFQWSNGNTTLTVQLRHGVQWSDGKPFTASDVAFSFQLLKKYPSLDGNGIWAKLTSVTATSAHTVVFQFSKPDVPIEWYILGQTYIVPQHVWQSLGNPSTLTNTNPVGTGPFLVKSFSSEMYTFVANPHYWGGPPKVKEIQFPAYTSNDSADLALAKSKIDWAGIFIPSVTKVYTSRNPKTNHYWFPPNNVVMLYTNLTDPLLSQLPVRQAISYAINREKLFKVGEYGYEPPASPTALVLPNNKAWVSPNLTASQLQFSYDPAKAVSILENAGYKKNAQGIFTSPSGKPLSFTLQVVTGWTDWDSDCAIIAQELKNIGIQVHVQEESFGAYYSALTKGSFQLAISWTNPGPTPYYLYDSLLSPKSSGNWEHWNNATTTSALQSFAQSSNLSTQQQSIYTIEQIMASKLPSIPLVEGATWYEYNSQNYTGWPTQSNPYAVPAPWSYPSMELVLLHLKPR